MAVAHNADEAGEGGLDENEPIRLSVIIKVRNGEPYLAGQLRSLAEQKCSFAWELIVVDNGSTDATAETARGFQSQVANMKVLSEPLVGKSYALNTGRAAASGEYLILVDADDEVGPGYLEAMAAALKQYEMVSSRVDTTLLNPPWAREELLPPDRITVFLNYLPYIPGSLIGIRASAWDKIGGFATDFQSAEDVDFTWRAQWAGITTGMASGAVLHFRRPLGAWGNFRRARYYARAHVQLYLRYRPLGQPRLGVPEEFRLVKESLGELIRHERYWQWRIGWNLGLVEGHLEESLRNRVWYP